MLSLSATSARREFFDIVKGAAEQHKIYHIQHPRGRVVLMSEDEYESLMETVELLSQPDFKKSIQRSLEQIKKGETFSIDDVFGKNK